MTKDEEQQEKGKGRINTSNLHRFSPEELTKEERAQAIQMALGGEGGLDISADSDLPASHPGKQASPAIPENVPCDPPPTSAHTDQATSSSGTPGTGDLILNLNRRRSSVAEPGLPQEKQHLDDPNSANVAASPKPISDSIAVPAQPAPAADSRRTPQQFASQRTKNVCCNIL